MEIKVSLNEYADVSFIKKLLTQLKGVEKVETISGTEEIENSWEEIENSGDFKKIIQQSRNQIKNDEFVEHSQEVMDSIFNKVK